jgi:uncharacterized protein YPO0396
MAGRLPATLLAFAALALAPGCGVLDELDKGTAELEKHSASAQKEKAEKAAANAEAEQTGAATAASGAAAKARQAAATWWQNARSIGSDETSEDVVRCVVGGADQYMHKPDCLMRGGTVAKRNP